MRRWRGEIDVPLTTEGLRQAIALGDNLYQAGGLDIAYHDWLSRSSETAKAICDNTIPCRGPRPWKMGPSYEGSPITPDSLRSAMWYVQNPDNTPVGGESFGNWYREWLSWVSDLEGVAYNKIGVVTHNRNIQALYASTHGRFEFSVYDNEGPDFCTVHRYENRAIEPWDGSTLKPGIYVIRHGETSFGT